MNGQIPVYTDSLNYSERIALGSGVFVLTFSYNARMDRWLLDVADANANILITGLPILTGRNVLQNFSGIVPGLPVGVIFAFDVTGQGQDPTLDTFGSSVLLFYWEP